MIVGLGNPGRAYEQTRHNVGFEVLDRLAARGEARFRRSFRAKAQVARTQVAGEAALLAKPLSFMNRSGLAVAALMRYYRLGPEQLIVVVDDADLPPGRIRVRAKGGAGNHNGLKSLLGALGSEAFARCRVGIGAKPEQMEMAAFVLSRPPAGERALLEEAMDRAVDAIETMVSEGMDAAMTRFNQAT
jgi:PTH1 family peptidyl-tRNA hydrolase